MNDETRALPLRDETARFGKASRGFRWVSAVLMFCLVPIGLFMAILSASVRERAGFVAAHQSLGLTVLVLVIGRIGTATDRPCVACCGDARGVSARSFVAMRQSKMVQSPY